MEGWSGCMPAPVLNYSKEPKRLVHVGRAGAEACVTKGENRRNIYTISTSICPGSRGTNETLFPTANRREGPGESSLAAISRTQMLARSNNGRNSSHSKGFQFNRQSRGKRKQHKHFPPLDLCDSITLNILSPEQAPLPSNRCSQPIMRLERRQPTLPALLIARLKSLYLIGPKIQKEIIPRGCLSKKKKKTNWFF